MAEYLSEYVINLAMPPIVRRAPHRFAMGDNNAYTFTSLLCDARNPDAELMAGTVGGELVRPDGVTVAITGTKGDTVRQVALENGALCNATPCSVTLPQSCFTCPGRVMLTIKLVDGTNSTQALMVTAVVERTTTDAIVDPGEVIPDPAMILAAAAQALAAAQAATTAAANAESKGDYALVRANAAIEATNQAVVAALEATAAAADARTAMAGAVRFDEAQTLTEAQAAQARGNIGAASADP